MSEAQTKPATYDPKLSPEETHKTISALGIKKANTSTRAATNSNLCVVITAI